MSTVTKREACKKVVHYGKPLLTGIYTEKRIKQNRIYENLVFIRFQFLKSNGLII